ncbi:MAG: hypothetical protein IJ123_05350 [Blautia sp.]|nr:hypothetical protein [Blautia sp.]
MFSKKKNGAEKLEERMQALSEEAGKILNSIQKMTSKDLEAELPILELRMKRILSAYEACAGELKMLLKSSEKDTEEAGLFLQQLQEMAELEMSWIKDTLLHLNESSKSLDASGSIAKSSLESRLRRGLEQSKS